MYDISWFEYILCIMMWSNRNWMLLKIFLKNLVIVYVDNLFTYLLQERNSPMKPDDLRKTYEKLFKILYVFVYILFKAWRSRRKYNMR